jgi:hypothetical protein
MNKENVEYTYTTLYIVCGVYGVLLSKKNEIKLFARKWRNLEIIMLSDVSQFHKAKYHKFSLHMCKRGENKTTEVNEAKL